MNGVEEEEEGEVAPDEVASNKVHIEGLSDLTTTDIENFANDHYKSDAFRRIEWIDDHSANITYASGPAAAEALQAFTYQPEHEPLPVFAPLDPRRAKTLVTHPHVELYVRMARMTDIKEQGAAERSRFYLLHPEYDPQTRSKRRRFDGPRRGGSRGGRGGHHDDRTSRRSSDGEATFDVSLYDDAPAPQPARASYKSSEHPDGDLFAGRKAGARKRAREEDLFAGKKDDRLRDRSASPVRDGDGRFGFSQDQPYRQTARARTPPLPRSRSTNDNYDAKQRKKAELFPNKKSRTALTDDLDNPKPRTELFPDRSSSTKGKELFPDKVRHHRNDARDIGPDDVANAIGKYSLDNGIDAFAYDSSSGVQIEPNRSNKPRDLFSRINGGPGLAVNKSSGRLNERPTSANGAGDGGFSIRGAGAQREGFSIRGASKEVAGSKELFPAKTGGGKDLFGDRVAGRQRRRAEDMF